MTLDGLRPARSRRGVLAAVAVAALVATTAACGSSGSGSGSGGGGGGGGSASAPKTVNIKVGGASAGIGNAAVWIAQARGYFSRYHLHVTYETLSSSSVVMPALASGSIQFAMSDSMAALTAIQAKVPVKIAIGLTIGVPGFSLVVTKKTFDSLGLVAGDVNGDLKKLKGKKIAVQAPTSTSGHILAGLVADAGLPASWLKYVSIASANEPVSVQHGLVDGFFQNTPIPQQAVAAGYGAIAFTTANVARLRNALYLSVDSSDSYLANNKAAVANFKKAILLAQRDLANKDAAALAVVDKKIGNAPAATVNPLLSTGINLDGSVPATNLRAMVAAANAWKLTQTPLTEADITKVTAVIP